ncbi:hypothetical protein N431DRAFT_442690 [Stipitochalara longipes BDJ]|nr:hypothetical protein N431DRAFT_442690 [Stipitochalara longipes BDJ]
MTPFPCQNSDGRSRGRGNRGRKLEEQESGTDEAVSLIGEGEKLEMEDWREGELGFGGFCVGGTKVQAKYVGVEIDRTAVTTKMLDFVRTRAAGLELAVLALEDVPVRSRVAHRADPLDECRLGFEQVEGMVAIARESHFGKAVDVTGEMGLGAGGGQGDRVAKRHGMVWEVSEVASKVGLQIEEGKRGAGFEKNEWNG